MTTAGKIDVKLSLNSEEFTKALDKAEKEFNDLERNLKNSRQNFENVSKAMAGMKNPTKEMTSLFEELKRKLQDDQTAFNAFQGKLKGLQGDLIEANPKVNLLSGAIGKIATPAVAIGAATALFNLGKQAVRTAAEFENLEVSFEVLAGGAEAGQRLTAELIELASKTPLTTEALANNAKTLLAFGEASDEVVKDLKLLGDISGGEAQRMQSLTLAFAQVGSTGRLTGQDLLQMVNAGFNPLQIMSEKTGKSMATLKDEMAKGKITFNDVKNAMIDATSEGGRFYGMMDKQSKTLDGRLSSLADTWGLVAKAIGDEFLPMAKAAVEGMENIGKATLKTIEWLKSENSTLQGLKQSWDRYWASKNKKNVAVFDANEDWINKQRESGLFAKGGNKPTSAKASSGGFSKTSSFSSISNSEEKQAKEKEKELTRLSESYKRQMLDIEAQTEAFNDMGGILGQLTANYQQRLNILSWYYEEKKKIAKAANGDLASAQQQFNDLETLKEQKLAQMNIETWKQYGNQLNSTLSSSFASILSGNQTFSDAMLNLTAKLGQDLIKIMQNDAARQVAIEKAKALAILAWRKITEFSSSFFGSNSVDTSSIGGGGMMYDMGLATYHSGGLVPGTQEQLAVVKGRERVLNPAEALDYANGNVNNANSPNGNQNMMFFNIKAWDGKDVIQTLKSNSQTINQIVAGGIRNNSQGLRTAVQST